MDPEEEITGAIDTSDNPNAGPDQAPVPDSGGPAVPVEDDATGVNAAQQQPQQQQPGYGPMGAMGGGRSVGQNAKAIIAYLMGAGASHPATLEQAGKQIDPSGAMSPADRNMAAISQIKDTEGEAAAWQLMQANRVSYNAKTAFAKTALTGNGQKPANLHAALQAANDAQTHVLDGSNVVFALHNGAVTATVTEPGSTEQKHINLSPQAFTQFLEVGGNGQWDKVMDQSAPAVLQRLAAAQQASQTPQAPQARQATALPQRAAPRYRPGGSLPLPQPARPQPQEAPDSAAVKSGHPVEYSQDAYPDMQMPRRGGASGKGAGNQPAIPGSHDKHGHYIGPQTDDDTGYSDELEARSRRIFPGVSQEQDRQQWMAAQEQQGTKNSIDRARASHDWTVDAARIKSAGGVESAKIKSEGQARAELAKAQAMAKRMELQHQDAVMRENGKRAGRELADPNFVLRSPEERAEVYKRHGIDISGAGAGGGQPAPQQGQAAPQPQGGGGVKKEFNGKMYTREEYEREVLGKK